MLIATIDSINEKNKVDYYDIALKTYVNKLTGRQISPYTYDEGYSFDNGRAKVKRNDKWGYINLMTEKSIPAQFDYVWPFQVGEYQA